MFEYGYKHLKMRWKKLFFIYDCEESKENFESKVLVRKFWIFKAYSDQVISIDEIKAAQ